ncbi:hypothetical protein D3C85_1118240 [compost metagenome]
MLILLPEPAGIFAFNTTFPVPDAGPLMVLFPEAVAVQLTPVIAGSRLSVTARFLALLKPVLLTSIT